MRHRILVAIIALAAASLLAAGPARAGVVMTISGSTPDGATDRDSKLYLEPDKVKIVSASGGVIYRDDAKVITRYSDGSKTYSEMDPEAMGAMQGQAMAAMQQRMAQMPEAQRKQMQAMLAERGLGADARSPAIAYRKLSADQTVGKWRCDLFEETENGKKVAELCIAHLEALGMTEQDLAAFNGLSKRLTSLGPPAMQARASRLDFTTLKSQVGFAGLPVRTVEFADDGQVRHVTVVKSVERTSLPPGTFEVPQGYTKREMPMRQPPQ